MHSVYGQEGHAPVHWECNVGIPALSGPHERYVEGDGVHVYINYGSLCASMDGGYHSLVVAYHH